MAPALLLCLAGLVPTAASLRIYSNGSHSYPVVEESGKCVVTGGGLQLRTLSLRAGGRHPTPGVIQTHEIAFDEVGQRAYVSLLTTGQLFELAFDEGGRLSPTVRRFTFNHPGSGLHNVAASGCAKGKLWVSTQYDNSIHLVDPASRRCAAQATLLGQLYPMFCL